MEPTQISQLVENHVAQLLQMVGVEAGIIVDIVSVEGKNYVDVKLTVAEKDSGLLIGHAGSRLKSLSAVLNMMLPRTEERYSILLDINGYREQRAAHIRSMADGAAEEAIALMEPVELEPMSPWERRIVHLALQERTDISTFSEGEEGEDRRVVIKPVSAV